MVRACKSWECLEGEANRWFEGKLKGNLTQFWTRTRCCCERRQSKPACAIESFTGEPTLSLDRPNPGSRHLHKTKAWRYHLRWLSEQLKAVDLKSGALPVLSSLSCHVRPRQKQRPVRSSAEEGLRPKVLCTQEQAPS